MTTTVPGLVVGPEPLDVAKPEDDDLQLYSVTTIIGALDKPALVYWSAEQTALAAVNHRATWQSMEEESGTAEAVKWLTGARFRTPKGERTAADLGTAVHAACESYVLTGQRPEVDAEIAPYLEQFDTWLNRFSPSFQAAEMTVYSATHQYAGTADGILTLDGTTFLYDVKTSKKSVDKRGKPTSPYPEQVGLQIAAYAHADFAALWRPRRYEHFRRRIYLLSQAEQAQAIPVPKVDHGLVIHLTPEHCEAWPIRCDDEVFEAYLFTQECFRWLNQTSKTVMGDPLVPAGAA